MIDAEVIERWMRDSNPIPTLDDVDQDELTQAVAEVHTRRAAAMQAPTQQPSHPSPPAPSWRQRRRKAWAFAAAFVLVLITIGITALALRNNDAPVADEPVTPTEPVEIDSMQWSRVPLDRLDRDVFLAMDPEAIPEGLTLEEHVNKYQTVVEVTDITRGGPGLVAVGWTLQSSGPKATVWTSPDGYTWSRVPYDETVSDSGDLWSVINDVAVGGPGLVGVGGYGDAAAVWTSPDGYAWSRVPQDPVTSPDNSALHHVVAAGPGLVALGDDETSSFVWTSPDGYTWSRVSDDEGVFERSVVSSVTAGGPGLVAVGSDESGWPESTSPVVWTSSDGYTWSRVPHDAAVFGPVGNDSPTISDVTAGGPGLVAVGGDGERGDGDADYARGAAVWTSPDGYTWSRVPHDAAVFGSDLIEMESVTPGSNGLLAVGGWPGSAMWFSPDGISWSHVPLHNDVFGDATSLGEAEVTAWGSGFIVVGGEHKDVAIWMAAPTDP